MGNVLGVMKRIAFGLIFFLIGLFLSWWGYSYLKSPSYAYPFPLKGKPSFEKQIEFIQKKLVVSPDSALNLSMLASLYVSQAKLTGDDAFYDKAEALAKRSLQLLPSFNGTAKLTLASIAEARHQFKEAVRLAIEVQQENKGTEGLAILVTAYLALGELKEAANVVNRLSDTYPTLKNLSLKGLVLIAQGKGEEGELTLGRAIALEDLGEEENSAWVRCLLGRYYLNQNRLSEAQRLFKESLRIIPQYHFASYLFGELEIARKRYAAAAAHFFNAFTSSRQVTYLRYYGKALRLDEKIELARTIEDEVEKTLREELKTGSYGHRLELAQFLLDRGQEKDIQEAIHLAEEELQVRKSAQSWYVLALAYSRAQKWPQAKEALRPVLDSGVQEPRYQRLKAEIEQSRG